MKDLTSTKIDFLKSLGSDKVKHGDQTLLEHLIGTRDKLKGMGKPEGPTEEVKWKIEKKVVDQLDTMHSNCDHTVEELVLMAIKKFISQHKDWLG